MRKITSCGLITLAALAATTPAFATDGTNSGSGVNTANNWNFSAAAVCLQEIAVVPVLGDYTSDHVNQCSLGNVAEETLGGGQALRRS
ncbi:hypothetical protein [Streptomyces sp. NPDC047065]|uniref:hypothetical protein n=1 Tax=Streptomyces sp. NPDC047065 TaxID=3154606 RepID=UPI003408C22F